MSAVYDSDNIQSTVKNVQLMQQVVRYRINYFMNR